VLNKCVTVQGQRLLNQWIKQPLMDLHKIGEEYSFLFWLFLIAKCIRFVALTLKEERQNIVQILIDDSEFRQTLVENYLKRFPDLQKIESRFIKKKANLQVIFLNLINRLFKINLVYYFA
jgi:DNA mismatch repair protein MSH2